MRNREEREDGENDNAALMAKSEKDSNGDSTERRTSKTTTGGGNGGAVPPFSFSPLLLSTAAKSLSLHSFFSISFLSPPHNNPPTSLHKTLSTLPAKPSRPHDKPQRMLQ
ncbi:hypothetical protein HAX54_013137 [Datura stramonium]|uniref:Uncharacterized protein n=1 Tax=Datura stramonium TaxID=4076 RepID=A0ABS8Y5R1_DATST|nr:hypothetical protein [Datura stramonium]